MAHRRRDAATEVRRVWPSGRGRKIDGMKPPIMIEFLNREMYRLSSRIEIQAAVEGSALFDSRKSLKPTLPRHR